MLSGLPSVKNILASHLKLYFPISARFLRTTNYVYDVKSTHFDYERAQGLQNSNWMQLTGQYCSRKFIPITRKVLLQQILADDSILDNKDLESFQKLSTGLDSAITFNYKEILKELKSLYNPLCSDRDTIQMKFFTEEQLLKREKKVLDLLGKLLQEANFYELPEDLMLKALDEQNVGENIVVSVSPKTYETLRIWVIGLDVIPIDKRPWYVIAGERAKHKLDSSKTQMRDYRDYRRSMVLQSISNIWTQLYGKEIQRVERYKRVIVALRKKGDMKLLIKSFKDIPCENLEFLFPDGKVRMRKLDKVRLMMSGSFFFFFILATTVVSLTEFKLEMDVILGLALFILIVRNWNIYKNMRNRYLLNWSETLYFKGIANNQALLTLAADRAEDEVYKGALLIYTVLHKIEKSGLEYSKGITTKDIKENVEYWMKENFSVDITFCPAAGLDYLQAFEIIVAEEHDGTKYFKAVQLEESFQHLPMFKRTPIFHHADLLNINADRTFAAEGEQHSAYLDYEGKFDWS